MPDPFYKVVLEDSDTHGAPLTRLQPTDGVELKVGGRIPVLSFDGEPRTLGKIIASIDDFAKLDDVRKQDAVEKLRKSQPQSRVGEIVRIEADSEPDCLGRLIVREVAPP